LIHRVDGEGTEDFLVFETRPLRAEISYRVDVSHFSGLRLVSNTLEFMNDVGAPLARVAPPYVVGADRRRHAAWLSVEGCAYDTNPAAPWGRTTTPPTANTCRVKVTWD